MKTSVVPFFSLQEQTQAIKTACLTAVSNLLDNQQFIGGPSITALEQEMAQYLKVKHVISCNSGTDALWLAVHALNVQPNDIVITTPFSFIASASELVPHGAHPVFVDVDPATYNLDPALVRRWLETNTEQKNGRTVHRVTGFPVVGIIPVHIFGQCADMDALLAIAKEYNLWTIEDTAQAIGSTLNGRYASTMGDIGTLSFYPTKNLGAFGDAGCVVTNDTVLAERLVRLRNHGRKNHYQYESYGLNSRLDAIQAEVLRIKLKLVDGYNEKRQAIAARYDAAFKNVSYLQIPAQSALVLRDATTSLLRMSGVESGFRGENGLRDNPAHPEEHFEEMRLEGQERSNSVHTYHQYSVVIKPEVCGMTRDAVAGNLEAFGIGTRVFYPQPLHAIDYLRTHADLQTATPVADYLCHNILALPIWPEMSDEQVDAVIGALMALPVVKQHSVAMAL